MESVKDIQTSSAWTRVKSLLKRMLAWSRIWQVGSLYFAVLGLVAIGFVTSVINTRSLGPQDYGNLKFVGTVFVFLSTISSLGLFYTGAQILASMQDEGEKRREMVGAVLAIAGVIAVTFSLVAVGFGLIQPHLFGNGLRRELVVFSPLVGVFVLQGCIENILQGENRIHELSVFRVLPGLLLVALLLVAAAFHWVTLVTTLFMQLLACAVVVYTAVRRLRPAYANLGTNCKSLWQANKGYGQYVYWGVLSNVATAYLSTFMISFYLDNTQVGFFSLAVALAAPLSSVSAVIGTTYFKDFAHQQKLPSKVTLVTVGLAGFTLIVFLVVIRLLVTVVYTQKFLPVVSLASIIAFGAVLNGIGDYFNRFLGAHALGKELMKGAMANGVVNVLGYTVLVKFVGVQGAAITNVLANATYCSMMVFYYSRYSARIRVATTG